MRPPIRKTVLLVATAVVLLLIALAVVLLRSRYTTEYVFHRTQAYLRDELGVGLTAAQVRMDLGRGSLTMQGVELRSLRTPDLPPILELDQASVNLGVWRTLTGFIQVESAHFEGVRLNATIAADGRTNLPAFGQKTSRTALPKFLISSLVISRGSLLFEDRGRAVSVRLPSWNLNIKGNAGNGEHGIALQSVAPGTVRWQDKSVALRDLMLSAVLTNADARIERFAATLDDSPIGVTGSVTDLQSPRLDLKIDAAAELQRLAEILGLKQTLSGATRMSARVTGSLSSPEVTGDLNAGPLAVAGYHELNVVSRFAWRGSADRLEINSLEASSPQGRLSAQGSVATRSDERSSVTGRFENWDLRPVSRTLSSPTQFASLATGTFSASWPSLDFSQIAGQSDVRLSPLRSTAAAQQLPVSGSGTIEVDGSRLDARIRTAGILGSEVSGRVAVRQQQLAGDLQVRIPDVQTFQDQLASFLGRERVTSQPLGGSAAIHASISGSVGRPELSGNVVSENLRVGQLENLSINAQADADPARIVIRQAYIRAGDQLLEGTGTLGLSGANPAVALNASITRGSAASLLAAMGSSAPIEGSFEAQARLTGTLRQLTGDLHLSAAELKAYGEPLGNLVADASISGGTIQTTRLELQKVPGNAAAGSVDGNASYDLGSGSFAFDVQGRDLRLERLKLPGDVPVQGTFALAATGKGTLAVPALDVRIEAPDLVIRQKLGAVSLAGHLRGEDARIEASVPLLKATLAGQMRTTDPYPAQLQVELENSDIAALGITVANDVTLAGSIDATVKASGNLKDWRAGNATASVRTIRLLARNHDLHNDGPMQLRYADGAVTIEPARLASGSSALDISGSIPVQRDAPEGTLSISGAVQLGDIYPFFRLDEGFFVNGVLKLDATLRGSPNQTRASGSFAMADGFLHVPRIRMPFTDIGLDGRLDDGSITLSSAKAQYGSSLITFSGDVPLGLVPQMPFDFARRQGPARFDLSVQNLTLESTGELPPGVGGVVDLRAQGELSRPALEALNGTATIDRLQLHVDEVPLEQTAPSVIKVRSGIVDVGSITLAGPETRLQLRGSAAFTGDRRLDLRLNGDIDAGIFTVLTRDLRATGNTHLEIALNGSVTDPQLGGTVELAGGQANLKSLNIGADSLQARLKLSNDRITVENISGFINGGVVQGGGTVRYDRLAVTDVNLNANMEGVYLEIPDGLRTVVNAELNVRSTGYPITVSGRITVQEGTYRKPVDLTGGLLSGFTANVTTAQAIDLGQPRNPLLSRVRYDVSVRTANPILVNNNVAEMAARGNLRLVGTYYRPSVVGRVNFEEGGEIRLNERAYVLERGSIQFLNETRIDPVLDLQAKTQMNPYDITIQVSGGPSNLRTTLTSDPPAPEPDLLSMLLTGRTQEQFRGEELAFAKEQALSLLAGSAGERISGAAQKTLGFSTVRIEPSLISPEQDPGARLTVGQNLTEQLSLIYSMNLVNSNDQIWIAEYNISRRFVTRGLMQQDNTFRFEFQHDLRFGGPAGTGRLTRADRIRREIGSLTFQGQTALTEKQLQSRMKLEPGDSYDFFKVQSGRDRLQKYFYDQGRLESRILIRRDPKNGTVNLGFTLVPGPTVRFFFVGYAVSGKVRDEVARIWREGIFDLQRADDAVQAVRRPLVEEGYLQSVVRYSIQRQGDAKEVHFTVNPGTRFSGVEIVFRGNSEVPPSELQAQLHAFGVETKNAVFNNPDRVVQVLENYYRQKGFLHAEVQQPVPELNPQLQSGQVVIAIKEGPLFRIGEVRIQGNTLPQEKLRLAAGLRSGDVFSPQAVQDASDRLDRLYHSLGYNDATVAYEPVLNTEAAAADINFHVQEHEREVIREIEIQGNNASSTRFIRRQVGISEGDIFNYDRIAAARKALYDTGAFTLVDLEPQPLQAPPSAANTKPVKLVLRLREIRPYRFRYGGFYDTDRGPGFTADLERRNLLGKAAIVGMHSRYDGDVQEFRSYYAQPFVGRFPLRTTFTGYAQRETRAAYLINRFGVSLMQQKRFKNDYLLDYGYRYERVQAPEGLPDEMLRTTATVPVGKLLTSLTRDTRDDILDATRGSFLTHAVVYAPSFLGSRTDQNGNAAQFVKYFGQYFRYVPLGERNESGKTRFVYAGALRIGLATGLNGNSVITPERFFAGGGTTLRGFRQDMVGPVEVRPDGTQVPLGGEALFLLNNEVRVPLFGVFDGVAFVDIGNVYPKVRDFDPFDVRKTAGIGLRVRTGYIVLRVDYGMKLDRKTNESRGALFFSIGQAY